MVIAENISIDDLHNCWLHTKPFNYLNIDFAVLKVNGAVKEYRLFKNGKESVVLQYPQTRLGFCILTDLILTKH